MRSRPAGAAAATATRGSDKGVGCSRNGVFKPKDLEGSSAGRTRGENV